jgi:peptide/nickel transport system substrate-binding protein
MRTLSRLTRRATPLVLLLAFLLAACSGQGGEQPRNDGEPPLVVRPDPGKPVPGGRIVQALLGDASNLIPMLASDTASSEITGQIFVAPLRYNKNLELVPWAAESYEILDGGRLLRFKLREDIRWTDGVPLTAEDVEFTYKLMIDPNTPTPYSGDYERVKEFKVTGPYGFEVRYDEPFARALVTWAHDILPKHALEGEDLLNTKYSREPLGAGPYKLKEWIPGRRIVLTANEDYFLGRPYIDEIVYRIIPDQATQFLELKAGNLDFMGLSPMDYVFQTSGPDWAGRFNKYRYLSAGYTYMAYNLEHPIFSDRRVRRALAHAVDKQEIVKGVLLGLGQPAVGPFQPGTWAYRDDIEPFRYDPELARRMLAEAGWEDHDGDGVLDKDGRAFSFTLLTNQGNAQRQRAATIIQYRLAQIGIKVDIRAVEWATFLHEFVDKGRFDALILAWTTPAEPDPYSVWHSDNAKDGGLNFVRYRNPELDRLVDAARRTLDREARRKMYWRVQEILHEDQPYCFLYVPMSLPIVAARVQGIDPAPAGIGYNSDRWWIPEPLQGSQPRLIQ